MPLVILGLGERVGVVDFEPVELFEFVSQDMKKDNKMRENVNSNSLNISWMYFDEKVICNVTIDEISGFKKARRN